MSAPEPRGRRWAQRALGLASLLLLGLALLDQALYASAADVLAGASFIYPAYVGRVERVYGSLAGFGLLALWFFLYRHTWLSALRPAAALLLGLSCSLLTLIAPLQALQAPAYHLAHLDLDGQRWQVFYQNLPLPDPACPYIVARCDALGWRCQALARLDLGAVCLGARAGLALSVAEDRQALLVQAQGETLLRIPLAEPAREEN